MAAAVEIRGLDQGDLLDQLDEFVDLLQNVVDAGASVGFLPPLARVEAAAYWQSVAAGLDFDRQLLLAAYLQGRLVGTGQLLLEARANGRHRAEVTKLLVHALHRRRGIGYALMLALEERAADAGRTLLVLDTRHGDAGEQLYRSLGYQAAGVIPAYALGADGALEPTLFMYKLLPLVST